MEEKHKFHYPLRVRYVETDAQARVFFGNYLTYFDVAVTEYLRAIGFTYKDMLHADMDMFYVEASCQYKGASQFDDLLHVHARISHIGKTSFTFEFEIYTQPDDKLITTGQIIAVAVDQKTEKPMRVPDAFRHAVIEFEGDPSIEHPNG
jgi:acyl-CoA thioester hydrolase